MRNLHKLSKEKIADYFLNNKQGDLLKLSPVRDNETDTGFTSIVIYKDKHMEIIYSYLIVDEENDDIIEQFTIYSKWFGKIKNSFFTLNGEKGKFGTTQCGVISVRDLRNFKSKTNHKIHNTNKEVDVEIQDFASLVLYCQKKYGASPSYRVTEVISLSPNSWVEIEITMPNGETHLAEGENKKAAANNFAKSFNF
ncbi:hypothetical protein JSO59_003885 [Riemerella anatipestifer]|uniref:hypothetical protein n=1 Tax=Riemerella anatipestifer TaxID=34085 RepID=UPI0030C36DCA